MNAEMNAVLNEMPEYFEWEGVRQGPDHPYWQSRHKVYLRTVASERQNHRCCYCGVRTTLVPNKSDTATLDHYIPVCEGGEDTLENSVMACNGCNRLRSCMPAEEYYEYVQLFGNERNQFKRAVKNISDMYVRIREIIKTACNTEMVLVESAA